MKGFQNWGLLTVRFNFQWHCKGLLFLYNSSCLIFLHFYIFDDMPDVQNFLGNQFCNQLSGDYFQFLKFCSEKG